MSEDNDYLLVSVHEEFAKRIDEEHKRQNKRIEIIEDHVCEITKLATSVEKLALSMDHMVTEQKEQGERLKVLEDRDGDTWRAVSRYIMTAVISLIIGYLASKFGLH